MSLGISIRSLVNVYPGSTIYVIGSGASLNFVPKEFFHDKICVGINETFRDFPLRFLISHHHENLQEAIDSNNAAVVTAEWHNGFSVMPNPGDASIQQHYGRAHFRGSFYTYKHRNNTYNVDDLDFSPIIQRKTDELFTSCSMPATAIHFAAHLGARFIVLCGVDGGRFNNAMCYEGYNHGASTLPHHIIATRHIVPAVCEVLHATWNVWTSSLNPFIYPGDGGYEPLKRG